MRYISFIFLCTCVLVTSKVCHGMGSITEITAVKNPTSIIFLDDLRVVIAGDTCVLVNLINQKENKTIDTTKTSHVILANNQTRFAVSSKKKLATYSSLTGTKKWQSKPIDEKNSIVFDLTNQKLFAYCPGRLTTYRCQKKSKKSPQTAALLSHVEFLTPQIISHPTKEMLLYPSQETELSSITLDDYSIAYTCHTKEPIISGIYSPDGTIIAINNFYNGCTLYNTSSNTYEPLIPKTYPQNIVSMVFHKNRPLLIILFDNHALHYWNYHTKKLIAARLHTLRKSNWLNYSHFTQRLAISPDGTKLMIALEKCLIFQIPQRTIFCMLYAVCKKHFLPRDTIKYILKRLSLNSGFYHFNVAELIKT